MSTNASNQPRQPKGVPTGGQWRAVARPEGPVLADGLGGRGHARLLAPDERERVKAWRAVASRYRHGDCGRREHALRGCDIACVVVHSKLEGDEGASPALRGMPWERSYDRGNVKEDNAAVDLMCRLVMHAVPRPPR